VKEERKQEQRRLLRGDFRVPGDSRVGAWSVVLHKPCGKTGAGVVIVVVVVCGRSVRCLVGRRGQ
jgi:hypothetical protein